MRQAKPIKFIEMSNGCMVPISHKLNADGYFRKTWGNQRSEDHLALMMHRVVYELHNGPIEDGYEVDHICRCRACCNPKHLQVLTVSEHKAKTNRQRSSARIDEARQYWQETGCTGTHLGEKFGTSFGQACRWIRNWRSET